MVMMFASRVIAGEMGEVQPKVMPALGCVMMIGVETVIEFCAKMVTEDAEELKTSTPMLQCKVPPQLP